MGQLQSFFNLLKKNDSEYSFISNTNQSLQTVSSCSDIVKKLSHLQSEYPHLEELNMFIELVQILQKESEMKLKKSRNSIFQPRCKIEEQDNADVLGYLINRIYRDIKRKIKVENEQKDNLLKIKLPMMLTIKYDIICQCGRTIYSTVQSQLSLHLTASSKYTNLQDLFDKVFYGESIKGFDCESRNCSHKKAVRICKLYKPLPETICIRVEGRNLFLTLEIWSQIIIKNSFIIDENTDSIDDNLWKYSDSNSVRSDYKYSLKSLVKNDSNFRYQCYKNDDDKWFMISDETIIEIEQPKILEDHDYILFFENKINNSSVTSSRVTTLYTSRDNFKTSLKNSLNSQRELCSKHKSRDVIDSNTKSIKPISDFEIYYKRKINRQNPISIKKLGCNQYLNIFLHAISSCEYLIKEIQQIVNKSMKKTKTFINLIMILDNDLRNSSISYSTIREWNNLYKTNMFNFMLSLLNELRPENKCQNLRPCPLEISTTVNMTCLNCGRNLKYHLKDSAITISVSNSMNIFSLQGSIDQIFNEQILEGYNCENKKCSTKKKSRKIVRINHPILNSLCIHIEKLLWNGMKNQFIYTKFNFSDILIFKQSFYENQSCRNSKILSSYDEIFINSPVNHNFNYHLQSLISYQFNDCNGDHYICYKKLENSWYRISDSSLSLVTLNDVLESDPYMLFYELQN